MTDTPALPRPEEAPPAASASPAQALPQPQTTDAPPATAAPPAAVPDLVPAACAAELAARFPALFGAGRALPIKLRIQADIQQRAPGVFSRKSLSLFLHRHTTSTAYLRSLAASPTRFDLDGAAAGEVAEEHRLAAQGEVDRRRTIVEERRTAERAAARQAQRQAEAVRREQERTQAPQGGAPSGESPAHRPPRAPGPQRPQAPRPQHARPAPQGRESGPRPALRPENAAPQRREAPPASPPEPQDEARRERAVLLRTYETSTLTRANFCVLKRISETDLEAQLALARQERDARTPAPHRSPDRG